MRYVMRIAEFSESSNLWTQMALLGYAWKHASLSIDSFIIEDLLSSHIDTSVSIGHWDLSGLLTETSLLKHSERKRAWAPFCNSELRVNKCNQAPLVCGPHAPELTVLFQCFVFPCRWQLVDKDSPCGMIKNDCWSVEDAIERWAGRQDAWVNMSAHALVPPTLSQSVWA